MTRSLVLMVLVIGCGGAPVTPASSATVPSPSAEASSTEASSTEASGPSADVRRRWEALRRAYLDAHALAPDPNAEQDDDLAPRCRDRDVGRMIVGVCGTGEHTQIDDANGWIVADEGVVELDEREVVLETYTGDLLRELALPVLTGDLQGGLVVLSLRRIVGAVSVGPAGLEHADLEDAAPLAEADTPCGSVILAVPSDEGAPISTRLVRERDGSLASSDACTDALDEVAEAGELAALEGRDALVAAVQAAAAPAPTCRPPSAAELRRAGRAVLAALEPDVAADEEAAEEDEDAEEEVEDVDADTRPALVRADVEAAVAAASAGCRSPSGAFLLVVTSDPLERAEIWTVGGAEAALVRSVHAYTGDDTSRALRAEGSADLDGDGTPETLVAVEESYWADGTTTCTATHLAVSASGVVLHEGSSECEPSEDVPVPFAVLARPGAPSALFVGGHTFAWSGTAVVETSVPGVTDAVTAREERRRGIAALRRWVSTAGDDPSTWRRETTDALVRCGVPEREAAASVEAVVARATPRASRAQP